MAQKDVNLKTTDQDEIVNEKMSVIFRMQFQTLILINLFVALAIPFSYFSPSQKVSLYLYVNGSLTFLAILLLILKRYIKDEKIFSYIYFGVSLIELLMFQVATLDFGIVVTMSILPCILLTVFINFNKSFILILLSLLTIILLYFFYTSPRLSLDFTMGYYVLCFMEIVICGIISIQGIQLFSRNETLLFKKINTITSQYDEIKSLNTQSNKIRERLESVIKASDDGILDIRQDSGELSMSPRSRIILGLDCSSMVYFESLMKQNLGSESKTEFFDIWEELKRSSEKSFSLECSYHSEGSRRRLKFNLMSYTFSEDGSKHLLLVVKDITNEFEQERRIYKSAYEDSLTGLLNRFALIEFIEEHRKQYFISCTAILDIDNFRFVNESFGYDIGDRLLKSISRRLLSDSSNFIKAVARLNSNDFALYLDTVVDENDFFVYIQKNYSQYTIEDIDIKVNFSIGMAAISDSDSADGLLKKAEVAMYKVKEQGKKGICVYSEDLDNEMARRLAIMNELEDAITNKEFYLNYQPKVNTEKNQIIGFEALIRWQSSKLGIIPPDEFIMLAEQSGLIHALGEFVIYESCHFIKKVKEENPDLKDFRISINVSAVQLLNSSFYNSFFRILEETGIASEMIGLEVTETAVMENKTYVSEQLLKFRERGIKIYLDDFGTGYSSLNYLTLLPIDILKIDKSFVDNIITEKREHQVVKMILSLAETFEFKTVAEGVETADQLKVLQEMGCKIFQGYYFSKPLAEDDAFKAVLAGHL